MAMLRLKTLSLWMIGFAALAAGLRGATLPAPPPDATSPIVELPKFEVSDSRILPPPEKWHYASIPGFEILSNVSERSTKRFVRDLMLLQDAISVIMPGLGRGDVAVPTRLILCGGARGFDRFLPVDRGDDAYRTNSLFFADTECAAIVVDFAQNELQLDAATTVESDPYRGFYKEYFRHLIRRAAGRPPAWFEEGLVQLFSAIDFNKKWITFAQIGDGADAKDTDFTKLLSQRALQPLGELFAQSAVTNDAFWSAQCYAFVHMCLYGRGLRYQGGMVKFVSRLASEAPSEALFKECFKMGYREMALELRGYLGFTDHKYQQFVMKKGQELAEPPPVVLRNATEPETGRITGETLRLGGHGDEAHLALIAPYIRGERDPQLLAALGLDERLAGHDERAKKFLEAAAKGSAVRPRAYLELARLRYSAVRATAGADARLAPAQVADVLAPLATARSQPPPLVEVFEFTAEVWSNSTQPPTKEDLKVVNTGVVLFPRRPLMLARAADLNLRHGDPENARRIIAHGLSILPMNSPVRVVLTQLQGELPPAPPAPPPAAAPAAGTPATGKSAPGPASRPVRR